MAMETHQYPTRNAGTFLPSPELKHDVHRAGPDIKMSVETDAAGAPARPKLVSFQLLLSEIPHHRARLPLRVHIQPHDTTDSIVATVKNFYGLYDGWAVSFEDDQGNTLIAQYENLSDDTTIRVRVVPEHFDRASMQAPLANPSSSPRRLRLDEPFQMSPTHNQAPYVRPASRSARKRSLSPASAKGTHYSASGKGRPEHAPGAAGFPATHATLAELDAANGFSDSDAVSVSSSRRAKSDQLASAEISLNNIVEGGRRKRAFESSELPLFIPPQVPITTSISSMSPQRRMINPYAGSPNYNHQQTFSYSHPLLSPQSHGNDGRLATNGHAFAAPAQAAGHRLRARTANNAPPRYYGNQGVLPTPDPTIASVISDEDVALQLMRLGDASNFSLGRTSTSTVDDALSGKAEAASSGENTDDDTSDEGRKPSLARARAHESHTAGPARKKQRSYNQHVSTDHSVESSDDESDEYHDRSLDTHVHAHDHSKSRQGAKPRSNKPHEHGLKLQTSTSHKKSKPSSKSAPASATHGGLVRKNSSASSTSLQPLFGAGGAGGDDDLSSKPRCQRCRKSKKGCDRQRPCQRCKDAGIGIDGCISEDEGNGRKGRYGRHMGVPLQKSPSDEVAPYSPAAVAGYYSESVSSADKSKKRKR